MKVLIDNGHGMETRGKRSPDGRLKEWAWTREVAREIVTELQCAGIDSELVVAEANDISLGERCRRVNAVCREDGRDNVLLVSVHVNAAGDGSCWHAARGWSGWVAPKASDGSKRLAKMLLEEATECGLKGNRSVPTCGYWQGDFAIVRDTLCTAVLTENLFMDNRDDVETLLSAEGRRKIVDMHVRGIINYLKAKK